MFLTDFTEEPLHGVTLLYGPAATGKTTACLEALVPHSVYISSHKNFNIERLRTMRSDADAIIKNIYLFEPKELAELEAAVLAALKLEPSLLVIDSLATHIRPAERKSGNLGLHRILKLLAKLSCPIILTSEVYDSFRESRHEFVGGDMLRLACSTIIELENFTATLKKHPALAGRSWPYKITDTGLQMDETKLS
jgi:hypothetical protein